MAITESNVNTLAFDPHPYALAQGKERQAREGEKDSFITPNPVARLT